MNTAMCNHIFSDGRRCWNLEKDSGYCSKHVKVYRLRRAERGEWIIGQPVDATMVKQHLRRLHAAGLGTRRIADLTGLTSVTVRVILNKDQQRVHPNTAARILAIALPGKPHDPPVADSVFIPAIGTQRRLQALVAIGHTQEAICAELGVAPNSFARVIFHQQKVTASFARRVDAVYSTMQFVDGGNDRARRRAAGFGWPPPAAWDDDQIDNPDAVYDPKPKPTPFIERYCELVDLGYTDIEIADKLGHSTETLERMLYQRGYRPRRVVTPSERAAS